jgi:hypothetical protein
MRPAAGPLQASKQPQPRNCLSLQLHCRKGVLGIQLLGYPRWYSSISYQSTRDCKGFGGGRRVLKRSGIGGQARKHTGGYRGRDRNSHLLQQLQDELRRGTGLRINKIETTKQVVGGVMIDINHSLEFTYASAQTVANSTRVTTVHSD